MDARNWASAAIFVLTYGGIALGRVPGLRLDRAGISLLGAALMIGIGVLSPEEAYQAVDLDTITLLLGMMIVVAHLRLSGFFRLVNGWAVTHAHSPLVLLSMIALTTGVFSAFLVNDAVCLIMAPLVVDVTKRLGRNPVPYLLAVAMGSNVGSVATITGNPQNMIVGVISQIPYATFAAALAPVAAAGLIIVCALIALLCRSEFRVSKVLTADPGPSRIHKPQMLKAILVTTGVVVAFFAGAPVAKAAIFGAALLLVTRQVKPGKVYREIDGPLLLMFAGLFIVVAGAEKALLSPDMIEAVRALQLANVWVLTGVTALLSNLVSNVPAVLVLKPFVEGLPDQQRLWLVIAMASTLAGNLTLVGSVANLIVAEKARAAGIELGFRAYLRVGVPVTVATLAVGAWWLSGGPGT
ncbi:anion transporter [Microvirga lotononidis]|uniref:Na+/H+ antiporter NhaD-like permease n=1 Tax=Microvirga lotononidis TaxID=864069 RepID=I4YWQ1_9HYPH|nr:anion transporter [Microvirga lotononidis]EIM28393.1 Na+/H+ antiporter NhaD-like permease [Microvirga lotononidis]WQO27523.1 anion transporter [Microvirga lotononidis]